VSLVWNLLSNAIKFTPAGGRVRVTSRRVESDVETLVADTGQGIPPEFLPHMFERFTQADSRSRRADSGLGLGLAIVRSVVELHRGTVMAESDGHGRGATFRVRLPLASVGSLIPSDSSARPSTRRQTFEGALAGVRIMCIDDSPDVQELVSIILTQCGAVVRTCSSTDEALATLARERPDVVISDIAMPGSDGYEFIRALRVREDPGSRIPAIALTAYTATKDRIGMLAAGFQLHVPKPIDPTELVTAVATLAGRSFPN
jgi:CheY-like chemotaxis protein